MSFKVGDKVKFIDDCSYEFDHPSISGFIRHGSTFKNSPKYNQRGAKIIKIVDEYCITRYLDSDMNYVDLAYRHNNLVPHEDENPNIITLKSFGDLSKSIMNDSDVNLSNTRELYFDNFNLNYFVGQYKDDIIFIKVRDGKLSMGKINDIFKVIPNGDIKIVNGNEFNNIKFDHRNIKINHRPLKLKLN